MKYKYVYINEDNDKVSISDTLLTDEPKNRLISKVKYNEMDSPFVKEMASFYFSNDEITEILNIVAPSDFNELFKTICLMYTSGTWEYYKTRFLLGEVKWEKVIASREDLYEYLSDNGFTPYDSLMLTEKIRRGTISYDSALNWPYYERMLKRKNLGWLIRYSKSTKYLPPREKILKYFEYYWNNGILDIDLMNRTY